MSASNKLKPFYPSPSKLASPIFYRKIKLDLWTINDGYLVVSGLAYKLQVNGLVKAALAKLGLKEIKVIISFQNYLSGDLVAVAQIPIQNVQRVREAIAATDAPNED